MKGENAKKRGITGKDWWGKRPLSGHGVSSRSKTNKFFKRLLHKIERRLSISIVNEEIDEWNKDFYEYYESYFPDTNYE